MKLACLGICLIRGARTMILQRRRLLCLAGFAAAASALPRIAVAQSYPSRPVRWIVPFPAGGSTDLVARLMAEWLAARLGQSFVIENKPGGGTNIAVQAAVSAPADGYTLLFNPCDQCAQPDALQIAAVLLPARHCAGGWACRTAAGDRPQPTVSGEDSHRVHRLRKGQSGQDQFRLVRRSHDQPFGHRTVQDLDRRRRRPRTISGRRTNADRS